MKQNLDILDFTLSADDMATASVKRYLLRLVYYQIVEKEDGKYRKTGKSWLRKPPK